MKYRKVKYHTGSPGGLIEIPFYIYMKISDQDLEELKNLEEKLWKADTRFDRT